MLGRVPAPTSRILARGLLSFWATWFSVVTASNAADALREAGVLSPAWRFASGNFDLVAETVALYSVSRNGAAVLFGLVLVLEVITSALFWRAAREPETPRILRAFFAGMLLFFGLLVFDEVLLIYRSHVPGLETSHFVVLVALIVSLILIYQIEERA